jgi:ankyrin repeat protein
MAPGDYTALEFAINVNDPSLHRLRGLLEVGTDPDCPVLQNLSPGITYPQPLVLAIQRNKLEAARLLLEYGANPNGVDCWQLQYGRFIPLIEAVRMHASIEMMELLMEFSADVNKTFSGFTALHHAQEQDEIRLLIQAGADVDASTHSGITPLHHASAMKTRMLIEAGANIHAKTTVGLTPLHVANEADTVDLLLRAGAEVDSQTLIYFTPLHSAVIRGSVDQVRLLLDANANIEARMLPPVLLTPLMLACRCGDASIVSLLLQRGAQVDAVDRQGMTALFHADTVDVAAELLQYGADVGARTPWLQVSLHFAAANGNANMIYLLVSAGVEVDAQDSHGRTAAHLAVAAHGIDHEVVATLIASGADFMIRDSFGRTPFEYSEV